MAERPPTANRHYLQLLGTYLVSTVPSAAAPMACAAAVALPADVQAQSILPDKVPAAPTALRHRWMYGVSTSVFARAQLRDLSRRCK